jgi:SpoVK/Ycf46/Vps4 family AAA+-type ATPase
MSDIETDFVHLARLALEGKAEDAAVLARRALLGIEKRRPDLAPAIKTVLSLARSSVTRDVALSPLPVDVDSRLELLRMEPIPALSIEPTWPKRIASELGSIIEERKREKELIDAELFPTRTILLIGPPGVGKTLAARWLALHLGRPLLTLDLAAVMSSFLGRTGNNIRVVLDYARKSPNVLLLDEFDSIAKRRDDSADVGELKRLVTVLLQAIDEWPPDGVLIAATNHPELLDSAVWRRFDRVITFPLPGVDDLKQLLTVLLGANFAETDQDKDLLAHLFQGQSFSEVVRVITGAKRASIMKGVPLIRSTEEAVADLLRGAPVASRIHLARILEARRMSQRQIAAITGLSRDTIRKHRDEPAKRRASKDARPTEIKR